jgi:beta-lactamase class A
LKKVFLLFIIAFALAGCTKQESIAKEVEITTPQQIEQTETSEIVVESTDKEIITESTESIEDIIIVDTELSEGTVPTEPPMPYYELLEMEEKGRDIVTYGKFEEEKIKELEELLDSYPKNISLSVYALNGEKALIYNGEQEYFSACTIKIPWMLYLCKGIDEGKYSKDDVLTYQEKHYHGGSGKIRYDAYGSTYTVEELITLCLSISDNVAYEMLVQYVDRNDFYAYIDTLECDSLHVPSWSIWSSNSVVRDYNRIWQVVYEYFTTNTTGAKILKNACTNTKFAYGVRTLKGEDYSHKSGDNFGANCACNDAGIVWAETPYVYAIFTKSEGTEYDDKFINGAMSIIHDIF